MRKRIGAQVVGWMVGLFVLVLRMTCRVRLHGDPRPEIEKAGMNHAFITFHASQLAGSMGAKPGTGTMVSRSTDGEILVPGLRLAGFVPIRGSSGPRAKGGATALHALIAHVNQGNAAMLAVDGPRGPRGKVQKGVGLLAKKANAAVIVAVLVPTRRWILTRTWDRTQIPKPFSRIDAYMSPPLILGPDESIADFVERVEVTLNRMEAQYDPEEASFCQHPDELSTPNAVGQTRAA